MNLFRTLFASALLATLLSSCAGTGGGGTQRTTAAQAQMIAERNARIAAEPRGDHYIARRFYIERTHLWGYVRRPGETWDKAKLVVMNERVARSPDRLPESPSGTGLAHGYDHNREYHLWGRYTGRRVYDPNSNLVLPEFELQRALEVSDAPGWLFHPGERFNGSQLLRIEPEASPR
jgi:hypothetical protein